MSFMSLFMLCHCANAIDASWVVYVIVYVMRLQLCTYVSYGFAVVAFMYDIAVMVFVAVRALQFRKLRQLWQIVFTTVMALQLCGYDSDGIVVMQLWLWRHCGYGIYDSVCRCLCSVPLHCTLHTLSMPPAPLFSQDFFDHIERVTEKDLEELSIEYQTIGPLLIKMEGLVVNTSTGCSPRMAKYFLFWERNVFDSLTKVAGLRLFECIFKRHGYTFPFSVSHTDSSFFS